MKKVVLSLVVASAVLSAAEVETQERSELVTHTELGYIETSGNTQTQTFNLESRAKKEWNKHVASFLFDAQYATNNAIEIKNKYVAELTYDFEMSQRFSLNYLLGYRQDRFSGFESQLYTGPGVKYKAIISKEHNLDLDGSLLYSSDRYDATYVNATTGAVIAYPNSTEGATLQRGVYSSDYMAYRLKGVYNWQIAENLKFNQEATFRGSFQESENYFVFSKTALSSKFTDMLSAGLSYKVDYVNIPAVGRESTDTTLTANLIVDY